MRNLDAIALGGAIVFQEAANRRQLLTQRPDQRAGKHHHPVLAALAFAHDEREAIESRSFTRRRRSSVSRSPVP